MQSLSRSTANVNAPIDDETLGWRFFFAGRLISECRNEAQRRGWLAACNRGRNLVEVL